MEEGVGGYRSGLKGKRTLTNKNGRVEGFNGTAIIKELLLRHLFKVSGDCSEG